MKILVVDDDPVVAEMLEQLLGSLGHAVDVINDGRDVIDRVTADAYGALLLDVRMRGLSGIDVFEMLRAAGSPLVDRTVFLSGDIEPVTVSRIAELGRPSLAKPFPVAELVRTLETVTSTA
jgi:CheY-like chemotaxis protein